jgi:hypothetical protein
VISKHLTFGLFGRPAVSVDLWRKWTKAVKYIFSPSLNKHPFQDREIDDCVFKFLVSNVISWITAIKVAENPVATQRDDGNIQDVDR